MKSLTKFSASSDIDGPEFSHPNIWQREEHSDWSRVTIGARDNEIPLILELCREMDGPFGVLYVLSVPRLDFDAARYQAKEPMSYEDLETFLLKFQDFFEQDGRHNIWVACQSGEGQFIFDKHNVVYAYGNLDQITGSLIKMGFEQGHIETLFPHTHHYHFQFDDSEEAVMKYLSWLKYDLDPMDDP